MRCKWFAGSFVLVLALYTSASAAGQMSYTQGESASSQIVGGESCDSCGGDSDECQNSHRGCRLSNMFGGGRGNQQSVDWGNCNCNGSYKFPVPPLYTYHWPGRYSQQLMTDYHSPWRFPPLRPYVDEPKKEMPDRMSVLPTSHAYSINGVPTVRTTSDSEPELLSRKIERYYGVK